MRQMSGMHHITWGIGIQYSIGSTRCITVFSFWGDRYLHASSPPVRLTISSHSGRMPFLKILKASTLRPSTSVEFWGKFIGENADNNMMKFDLVGVKEEFSGNRIIWIIIRQHRMLHKNLILSWSNLRYLYGSAHQIELHSVSGRSTSISRILPRLRTRKPLSWNSQNPPVWCYSYAPTKPTRAEVDVPLCLSCEV